MRREPSDDPVTTCDSSPRKVPHVTKQVCSLNVTCGVEGHLEKYGTIQMEAVSSQPVTSSKRPDGLKQTVSI